MLTTLFMDYDGVIQDTETEVYAQTRDWIARHTGHVVTLDEYSLAAGSWHESFMKYLLEDCHLSFDPDAFFAFYRTLEKSLQSLPLLPGVQNILEESRALGISVGIVSSNVIRTLDGRLDRLKIRDFFDFIVTGDDVSHLKPAPDIYQKAIEVSGADSNEALVIEDSKNGYLSATAAGLRTLAVPCTVTRNYSFSDAWKKVDSLADLSLRQIQEAFNASVRPCAG